MQKLMRIVRGSSFLVVVAAVALFVGALANFDSARAAVATTQAEDFAQRNIDKGYSILKDKTLAGPERHAQFRTFMLSISDMQRIGIFALGQYANRLSQQETNIYVAAFTDYAVPLYETWLSKYNERTLKITGTAATRGRRLRGSCGCRQRDQPGRSALQGLVAHTQGRRWEPHRYRHDGRRHLARADSAVRFCCFPPAARWPYFGLGWPPEKPNRIHQFWRQRNSHRPAVNFCKQCYEGPCAVLHALART